ncbi:trypsin-like peptidase domain-containing protein [Pseudonocardia adelaidensis]|uniref:trypsin-like peptidase domain-containing protein n=1 Tax=Pseudonocardia adelaidensis TaxID=648754 RepID=UPI003CD06CDB
MHGPAVMTFATSRWAMIPAGRLPCRTNGGEVKTSADAPVSAHAVARIRNEDGIVGGGFLVGPDLVATCAHVVADALGANPYSPSAPDAPVQLDFPLPEHATHPTRPGDAVVERWVPIAEDGGGDLALLRLDAPPPGVRVPPLRRIERLWDHEFTVLGFPAVARSGGPRPDLRRRQQHQAERPSPPPSWPTTTPCIGEWGFPGCSGR